MRTILIALWLQNGHNRSVIEFEWDEHNIGHLVQHDVTPAEFEFVVVDTRTVDVDYTVSEGGEDRFRVVGMTQSGRLLSVVYAVRGGKIRAVTAFPASKRELIKWQEMQNE
jgi:uncharacterized DUF497 family protein